MTDDTGVICRRCGFANVAGDQFCGSCGAFLEWEGETAAARPRSPPTPAPMTASPGSSALPGQPPDPPPACRPPRPGPRRRHPWRP